MSSQQNRLVDVNHLAEAEPEQARNYEDGRGRYLEEFVAIIQSSWIGYAHLCSFSAV